jgi:hypothetical protein
MATIHTTTHTDSAGILKLELPVGIADADVDVTLLIEPKAVPRQLTREEWLRFIENTAGKWQGDPLVRPEQGILEHRKPWG